MLKKLFSTLLIVTSLQAMAQETHEVGGGSAGSISFQSGNSVSVAYGTYSYNLGSGIQLGAALTLAFFDGGNTMGMDFRPTYNIGDKLNEAIFITPYIGFLRYSANSISDTSIKFGAELGKRFALAENFAYKPHLGFVKYEDGDPTFSVNFLSFSGIF